MTPKFVTEVDSASMWPRLVNRGREAFGLETFGEFLLQCGRGWLTAEGSGLRRAPLPERWLQCGRGWLTAEGPTP